MRQVLGQHGEGEEEGAEQDAEEGEPAVEAVGGGAPGHGVAVRGAERPTWEGASLDTCVGCQVSIVVRGTLGAKTARLCRVVEWYEHTVCDCGVPPVTRGALFVKKKLCQVNSVICCVMLLVCLLYSETGCPPSL